MSGFGAEEDLRQSREAGFFDHLTKPIDLKRLDNAIQSATDRAAGPRERRRRRIRALQSPIRRQQLRGIQDHPFGRTKARELEILARSSRTIFDLSCTPISD